MAVGEIVDRASDRLVGLVESAAQRSQICRASPPSSSLERDFCPRRLARQKGPEDDVSAQRPEIGDHHMQEMAAKNGFSAGELSVAGFGRLGTLKNGQSAALVRLMLSIASPAEHFGDWLGSAEFLRSSSRLPLLVHPSSTPLALFIYERFLEELRTSRSWINAPSANPLMTRAMRICCGSKFAPHISPATKSSHEYKNRNTRRGFLDVDPRAAVSLIVVGILVPPQGT
jgi:hypothetical protein